MPSERRDEPVRKGALVEERKRGPGRPAGTLREQMDEAWGPYITGVVELEMGKPLSKATREEFNDCLRAVAREKGWQIYFAE